jgi:aminoglycoside phosphotransferase (APT) family kinase protein
VGYKKLSGISLLRVRNEFNAWDIFAKEMGSFLGRLHSIPKEELNSLSVLKESRSHEEWRELGRSFFERTRNVILKEYASQIENFFDAHVPRETEDFVLCHNDLGIEHILIKNGEVSGIIDWGGVALADPACDFARIYRDMGAEVTDGLIREYTNTQFDKAGLRERTIFIGRCLFFEDLFYGVGQEEYLQKSLDILRSMF